MNRRLFLRGVTAAVVAPQLPELPVPAPAPLMFGRMDRFTVYISDRVPAFDAKAHSDLMIERFYPTQVIADLVDES